MSVCLCVRVWLAFGWVSVARSVQALWLSPSRVSSHVTDQWQTRRSPPRYRPHVDVQCARYFTYLPVVHYTSKGRGHWALSSAAQCWLWGVMHPWFDFCFRRYTGYMLFACLYRMLPYLSFFLRFFLTYLLPYLSFLDPLRCQDGCRKRRLNLALVFVFFCCSRLVNLCFCCVKFNFFHT